MLRLLADPVALLYAIVVISCVVCVVAVVVEGIVRHAIPSSKEGDK
jgi:hypothetical protein